MSTMQAGTTPIFKVFGMTGGQGQGGRGKGKWAIVCGHLSGQGENGESAAVQSCCALPMGRCASPP